MDEKNKEAVLKIAANTESIICYSYPCTYNVGDILLEPLECLDIEKIVLYDTNRSCIEKLDESFKYKFVGMINDIKQGLISVYEFEIHIDEEKIPKDLKNGMYIQFTVPRVDVW